MDTTNILEILNTWHKQIRESQHNINLQLLREIINKCHEFQIKYSKTGFIPGEEINEESLKILNILMISSKNNFDQSIEEQTLCSTAYCNLLSFLPNEHKITYLQSKNKNLLETYSSYRKQNNINNGTRLYFEITNEKRNLERRIATQITGLYQSNLLKPTPGDSEEIKMIKKEMIISSFHFTAFECLTYSCCTFLNFKNLNYILNKVIEWNQDKLIDDDEQNLLLYVVFNNWENLISGVREWNIKIWNSFLKIINKSHFTSLNKIIESVMEFPWNKAKYFALSEIISFYIDRDAINNIIQTYPQIICGLYYSLRHSPLVSAGTDFYKVMLSKIHSYSHWSEIFLNVFKTIFVSTKHEKRNILMHWIPATVKKYPEFIDTLIDILLENQTEIQNNYFSLISFIKFCRKNGLLLNDWKNGNELELRIKTIIEIGLVHVDEDVRAEAFHVVCETNKQSIPCSDEMKKVKEFLENNINNDSTPFRQNNLNSFTLFFIRLCDSYLALLKKDRCDDLNDIGNFLTWVFDFLHVNLDGLGNYQRKIMSLQMYNIMLQYLCQCNNRDKDMLKKLSRKKRSKEKKYSIVDHWRTKDENFFNISQMIQVFLNCLKDNTDDIREIAADILINYFINDEAFSSNIQQNMFKDALKLCNSHLFYESASGCLIFRILAHSKNNEMYANDTIHEYLLKESFDQFEYQKDDLLMSLFNNKPLHGVISALNVYIQNCDVILSENYISSIQTLLETVSNHFINILCLKSISGDFPPSFAEMGESIEEIIKISSFKQHNVELCNSIQTQPITSDAHQLILNNIWLNLKACCELSATIIRKNSNNIADIENLLGICIAVLTKCRHKGAIEAAGVCLGSSVKHLTSTQNSKLNGTIISQLLERLLLEFTSQSNQGGSVTRRSAGLTILVHRIVTNDSQDDKPLFHLTMKILLQALTNDEPGSATQSNDVESDIANERDIPLARALHLLCRTVCESSLAPYIIQYAHQLAHVCFKHLISQQWQVRNAALQLYGSLVPKLIGQRKNHSEDTWEAPVSSDELFCHIPSLWNIVKDALRKACELNTLVSHSNTIPILSLLSSTARRYCLSTFNTTFFSQFSIPSIVIEELLPYLIKLLGSPIHAVRNLCAKTVNIFYKVKIFKTEIYKRDLVQSENELHGLLLTLKYYVDFYYSDTCVLDSSRKEFDLCILQDILLHLEKAMSKNRHSYVTQVVLLEIKQLLTSEQSDLYANNFEISDDINNSTNIEAGFYLWYKTKLSYSLKRCRDNDLVDIVKTHFYDYRLLELDNLGVLKQRLLNGNMPKEENILKALFETLLKIVDSSRNISSKIVYEIMYILCSYSSNIVTVDIFQRLMNEVKSNNFMLNHVHTFLLPLLCCISCNDKINTSLQSLIVLSEKCKQFSKPEHFDAETRLICAISLKHLIVSCDKHDDCKLSEDSYAFKRNVYISAIWLLQDEDCDIRKECARGHIFTDKIHVTFASYQLSKIFTSEFVVKKFNHHAAKFLIDVYNELPSERMNPQGTQDLINPFNHNITNIYWEPAKLKLNTEKLIKTIKMTEQEVGQVL